MIAGVGVDIVEISRIERAIGEYGDRFVNRVFTGREIDYCERVARKAERYATRFAAKEAARKALGGATPVVALSWQDVEIISSTEGAPQLQFHGRAAEIAEELKIIRSHVSLSHAQDHAVAFVVLEVCGAALGASTA
jgi:holo-[acyl-carrier protein] synthase